MEELKYIKLKDVCDLIPGFAFKSNDFGCSDNRVIKIGDIQPPYVKEESLTAVDISKYPASKLEKFKVKYDDFVLAMTGATIGKIGRYIGENPVYLNQRVLLFKPKDGVNRKYIYYCLMAPTFQKYIDNHIDSQTAQPNISANSVSGYEIPLPDIATQNNIASILSSIDEKIELNNRINHNLEEQLSTNYEELITISSHKVSISSYALKVSDGVHNTVSDDPNGEFYLLSCKNLKDGKVVISDNERKISLDTFQSLRKRTQMEAWDILLSSVGTIGELVLLKEEPVSLEFQRSVAIIKASDKEKACILFSALKRQKNELIHAAHGAVQQCLFLSDIKGFEIDIPDDIESTRNYTQFAIKVHKQIAMNQKENHGLELLRDSLLPKLIYGGLNINEVDC